MEDTQTKRDGRRKYLSLDEVARELGISRTTVYEEVVAGNLRAKRFGKKQIRVHVDELARYEREQDYAPGQYR